MRFVIPGTPRFVGPARHRIVAAARCWSGSLSEESAQAIELVASELLTNAVKHSTGPLMVGLYQDTDRILLEVFDGDPEPPKRRPVTDDDENGRGLSLINALTVNCGWEPTVRGKKVWAEMQVLASSDDSGTSNRRPLPRLESRTGLGIARFAAAVA
ncbi:ATP-binding protein [Streptantibioticus ferralitis]|uniref:ATP-binding protein n=1 Tax=Streptantibioticus ferralitis TaxID=236510 RepID=A0ABT5ZDV3_9ACTN|nr:ATP-binding protein [Streptantibioticus ferralitis]MDF2261225.1 ATP-binding protein [Streptantibioticus ferralitis]